MKNLRFFIVEEASLDLEKIWTHTLNTWSLKQADKYYNDIIVAIELLCTEPKLF
jgi:toxin ParE1/3/4